ncbi:PASTA domain-containing protein [Glaciihabitans sp. INWT7]|uniref:transglycosylase domain-containing protein n=1 Tax=Glaciihabitans sp. INWT7 TaxID=2596912 RepID=UPI001624DDDA|nr:transglycosylase domain-containing protein [Glaciihabitans sp. INWT7]QNE45845.1 PASTA domain-containing protein [Glaciihabitans sp. INWT7]
MSAQKLKPSGVLGGLLGLLGFSVLAGVLVTAMVTPAIAVTSMTAQGSIDIFENLPDSIKISAPSQQNQIFAMRGGQPEKIATIYKQNRQVVGWDAVSPFLKQGAVDGEDRRFYDHGGVDVPSIARAAITNTQGGQQSGSSTLDMQLVKNILVQEAFTTKTGKERDAAIAAASGYSIDRKLKEMKLAIGLDKAYTKKEILLGYLNIVGMGSNTYGVESAAQLYYGVSAKDVTLPQAASLIAIVQQPTAQNLLDPKRYPANKLRRDQILNAMLAEKDIAQKQHDDAIATPIESYVKLTPQFNGCRNAIEANAKWPCDYVSKVITADAKKFPGAAPVLESLGATAAERQANWDMGGYKIYTSIDLDLQDAASASIAQQAPPTEARFPLGAAADTVEGGTGRILVMTQNKLFDDAPGADPQTTTAVNFSTDFPYGGSRGFPTGSTYKVFDLANWLQTGHGLNDLVDGHSPQTYKFSSFNCGGVPLDNGGTFLLKNDSGSGSYMTVKSALIGSVNNSFMQMAQRQDLCSIRDTAASLGAHRADGTPLNTNPNTILGSNEQAPLTIAAAAAAVGANGNHCEPIIIDSVVNAAGKTLPGQAKTCNQGISADVAAGTLNAMAGSMQSGTSSPGNPRDGLAIGGKTGTSDTADHVWIMGTTTKIGTAVWTGNISGHTSLRRNTNPITRQNYASYARFNIFKAIMKPADAKYGGEKSFPAASAAMLGGSSAIVPSLTGQTSDQAQRLLTSLKFQYTDGGPEASGLPAGRITRTDPAAGSKVPSGANITVFTSDGSLSTTMPNVTGLTRQVADAAIASAGFDPSKISYQWAKGNPLPGQTDSVCIVQASNPSSGSAATKTDPVTLTVYGKPDGSDPGGVCPK